MGTGGKRKNWPKSWRQAAATGGAMVLKGRSFEREYVVLPLTIEAEPEELVEKVEAALTDATKMQRPS